MPTETKNTHYVKKIARVLLKIVLFLLLFVVIVFLLILTPPVQRFASHKVASYLQNKLKTRVDIGGITFGLTGNINLHNVYIEDRTKDTLLSGGTIKANVNLLKLLSSEVEVKGLTVQNVTTKIKRVLPDTVFNFQFIADAFMPQKTNQPDTAKTTPLKLDVNSLTLDNINVVYKDVITGNDMFLHLGSLDAKIDTLNPYTSHYAVPKIAVSNVVARVKQFKPIVEPQPLAADVAEAAAPITMELNFGTVDLNKIDVQYDNDISALYAKLNVDNLLVDGHTVDLQNRVLHLDELRLNNSSTAIRLGKKPASKEVAKKVSQQAQAQAQNNWLVRVDKVNLNGDAMKFDDDNKPRAAYGMDYAHLNMDSLTLHINDMVFSTDTIGMAITKATVREQSGFQLDDLQGDIFYGPKQAYIKNLYFKTPGSELKRDVVLEYPSMKALTDSLAKVQVDIDIPDSYIQVKDILVFAPQLRTQPAFANRNAVWHINLQANGNMDRLHIANLQFRGFRNTSINASGTLANTTNPNAAGGFLTIKHFHTTQSDIALLTGQNLASMPFNLPQSIDVNGTVNGNAANLRTNLNVYTSEGNMTVNGHFTNLTQPARATYAAVVRTNGLRLGHILKNPQVGNISATLQTSGTGFTPDAIHTNFSGTVYSAGFNNYTYRNIHLNGSLNKTVFNVTVDANDPNLALNLTASGNYGGTPSFRVTGMIDSVKTMPLHFTTQPMVFHGKIDADLPSVNPDYLVANVMITQALFVSGPNRLPLDTLQLTANHTDTGEYIRLNSDIVNAQLQGQFRLSELGSILQDNIQPYFSTGPYTATKVHPYHITFSADVISSPLLSSFVPGLDITSPIHADGSLATDQGLQATVTSPHIVFSGNDITGLKLNVTTDAAGMHIASNLESLKSSSFNIYNTAFNATALHNTINFNVNVDDKNGKDKYYLSGLLTQPATGSYSLHLNPDSLLLNYNKWTVAQNNAITFDGKNILASNFVLQQAAQQLAIQSQSGAGSPLNVNFTNFQIATITGFMKQDSLAVNGVINGGVTLKNLMEQPVFTSDLTINDLSLQQDTVGNVHIKVDNTSADRYQTLATITGRGNDVELSGYFAPQGKDIALNLDLAIRQINLSTIEGATAGAISNAKGAITGTVAVRGTTTAPKVNGNVNFNNVVFDSKFIGNDFRIDNQQLVVQEDGLHLNHFTIRDSANNALVFNGEVLTPDFTSYNFNLDINARDFRAVNTTKQQSKIYYGQLYLSTDLHIGGTNQNPVVDGALTVSGKTNFYVVVPQQEPGVVSREGIVQFVDMDNPQSDSLFLAAYDSLNKSKLTGFDVAANITIDKNATFNIIVDEANGDFLNVKGDGLLSAGIDPSGKITLTGTYELNSGAYQLSYNFLQRRFDIEPGSKITWLGEPTNANLDVTAVYIANTAPLDLVSDQLSASQTAIRNTFLQKLPFEVLLKIGGQLMKPQISFDITLPGNKNYNVSKEVIQTVDTRLTQIRQEPSEMNKQVFALLLLGRFVGENPFQSSGEGFNAVSFAKQSVSKLLTEQLNRMAEGLIQGVDLNFDVATTQDYTTGSRQERTDLNVGLSKRLLSNRLTVSVGSNFELMGAQNSNQRASNIAGNVALNYQLSKDGRYMLRAYRKNEYQAEVEGYVIETGLSFIITVDYNHFKELLSRKKAKAKGEDDNQTHNDGY